MKRALCLVFAVILVLSFSGCSKSAELLTVSGTSVPSGVYAYYLNKAISSPEEYGLKAEDSAEKFSEKAAELCARHVAAENLMTENGITLDLYLKSEIADSTESIWSLFGQYYKSIGVTKPDITEINAFEARKKQLVQHYYGADGKKPVSEDDLKQKFVELYVGFKGFEVSLTKTNAKGETVDMTDKEKEAVEKKLKTLAQDVDSGKRTIDEANEKYFSSQGLIVTEDLQVALTKKNDPMYDDDFFDKMSTISHGRAAIVKSGKSIYVVQRMTIASSDDDAFAQYRTQVLETMRMPNVEKKIAKAAGEYEIKLDAKRANAIFAEMKQAVNAE